MPKEPTLLIAPDYGTANPWESIVATQMEPAVRWVWYTLGYRVPSTTSNYTLGDDVLAIANNHIPMQLRVHFPQTETTTSGEHNTIHLLIGTGPLVGGNDYSSVLWRLITFTSGASTFYNATGIRAPAQFQSSAQAPTEAFAGIAVEYPFPLLPKSPEEVYYLRLYLAPNVGSRRVGMVNLLCVEVPE